MENKLSEEEKERIFRPFKIESFIEYCLITELPSNQSKENIPEIELYGSPSVSTCNVDVRWQPVSCATYSFKSDEDTQNKNMSTSTGSTRSMRSTRGNMSTRSTKSTRSTGVL